MRLNPFDLVVVRCDVWQPGQWHHQWQRREWIKIALKPEISQGDIADVKEHPGQVGHCNQSNGLVPAMPWTLMR